MILGLFKEAGPTLQVTAAAAAAAVIIVALPTMLADMFITKVLGGRVGILAYKPTSTS